MKPRFRPSLRRDVYLMLLRGWILLGLMSIAVAIWILVDAASFITRIYPSITLMVPYTSVLNDIVYRLVSFRLSSGFYLATSCLAVFQGLLGTRVVKTANLRVFRLFMLINLLGAIILIIPAFLISGVNKQASKLQTVGAFLDMQNLSYDGTFREGYSKFWSEAQQKFACCGLQGSADYKNASRTWKWHQMNQTCDAANKCYTITDPAHPQNLTDVPIACCIYDTTLGLPVVNNNNTCPRTTNPFNSYNLRGCAPLFVIQLGSLLQQFVNYIVFLYANLASCFMHMGVIASAIRASIMKIVEKRMSIAVMHQLAPKGKLQLDEVGVTNVTETEAEGDEDSISIATADFQGNRVKHQASLTIRSEASSRMSSRAPSIRSSPLS